MRNRDDVRVVWPQPVPLGGIAEAIQGQIEIKVVVKPAEPDWIERLATEWMAAQDVPRGNDRQNPPAVESVLDLVCECRYVDLWNFIKVAYRLEGSDLAVSSLAAGPLEDLLGQAGDEFIAEVELLARRDARFKHLLGGVWQGRMSDAIWARVLKSRGEPW